MTLNGYTVDIAINGAYPTEFDMRELTFSMRDSIHSLYSKGSLKFNDVTGYLLESRMFTDGIPIELTLGFNEVVAVNKYLFHRMEVTSTGNPHQLGGEIEVSAIHESYRQQDRKSRAYDAKPSQIMEGLLDYVFFDKEIEGTKVLTINKLYCPRMNQEEFVQNILLPTSLSLSKNPSPYYCFIDCQDVLHYESLLGMMSKSPVTQLYLTPRTNIGDYYQKILSFSPFSSDVVKLRDSLDFSLEYLSDDGNFGLQSKDVSVSDIDSPLPIYDLKVGKVPVLDDIAESFDDLVFASAVSKQRYALLQDRVLVTIPLYVELCAGKMVSLDTVYGGNIASDSYSGNYLIEQSDHIWNGENQSGFTQLVLTRVATTFTPDFELEGGMKQ